jgi:SAM-dependent methyltransferase
MIHELCNLCGADMPLPFLQCADRFSGESFQYVRCHQCGLIYLHPRPTPAKLVDYYPKNYEAYYTLDDRVSRFERWKHKRGLDVQLNFVERHTASRGRLLDVGCGAGNFLNHAKNRGWTVSGIEWVDYAAELARKQSTLPIYSGSLETAPLSPGSQDVITLWDVLEHLPDPMRAVQVCYRLLAPQGLLFFSIPNLASFSRSWFGQNWIGWDAPRHLYLFDDSVVQTLLVQNGFQLVAKQCILGEEGAFILSLQRTPALNALRRLLERVPMVLLPYRQIAYTLNRGAVITFVARKTDSE